MRALWMLMNVFIIHQEPLPRAYWQSIMGLSPFKRWCIQNLRYAAMLSGLVANVNCFFPRLSGGRLCFLNRAVAIIWRFPGVSWVPRIPQIIKVIWSWLSIETHDDLGIPDFELRKPHCIWWGRHAPQDWHQKHISPPPPCDAMRQNVSGHDKSPPISWVLPRLS